MPYTFDQIFAADPANPERVASNGVVTIFAPGDASKTPVQITDTVGAPTPNPVTVNASGFGPAFMHATLDRLAWEGGGFSGFFTSYEGMKEEAVDARQAAESAAATAADAATTELEQRIAAGEFQGEPGRDGSNVLPTDEAIAESITTPGTPANTALSATIAEATADKVTTAEARKTLAGNGGVYLPSEYALLKWRAMRSKVLAGLAQGHIAVLGDSIPSTALPISAPKYVNNWPGRVRQILDKQYGPAGTGMVIADANIRINPTWDDRFTYNAVTDVPYGFHKTSAFRFTSGGGGWLDFTATCDEFIVFGIPGASGANTARIDGATVGTFRNVDVGGVAVTFPKNTGNHSKHIVTEIPAGTLGPHTFRFIPEPASNVTMLSIEGRINTPGTFRVSNPSISGKGLWSLFGGTGNNDEANGFNGLPLIDTLNADLLVIAIGINDWQGGTTAAQAKAWLKTLIQRQRSSGTNVGGGAHANGDALLVWNPQPDVPNLDNSATSTWDAYRTAYYEVADEENVALLDMGERWKDFATGNALGLFGDGIHPNDTGSLDIAPAVVDAVLA